ncbi:hypothetical protein [Muricoccus nepalensis]|uniref:hypothetical protein n=1 Tax=Muricoccus nepalensis TaxID=1854500 RepID=UPI00112D8DC6|nr:hypothetical protein [Roseomonas nepalensis]
MIAEAPADLVEGRAALDGIVEAVEVHFKACKQSLLKVLAQTKLPATHHEVPPPFSVVSLP